MNSKKADHMEHVRSSDQPNVRHREDDHRSLIAALLLAAAVVAVVLYTRLPERPASKEGATAVAATIFPIYDLARNIAPAGVDVLLILPPGASPHTFEPTPARMKELGTASVVYAVGHGLDSWAEQLAEDTRTGMVVVDKGVPLRSSVGDGEGGDGMDPHYWLSALNAMTIVRTLSADLQGRFPDKADEIRRRADEYLSRLRELHSDLLEQMDALPDKRIITLHDAWYYFANAYGLDVVGTFEPSPGREPTPRYIAALQAAVAGSGATRLFSEPQISTGSLDAFVRDNGLTIEVLDPIGGVPGRESYEDLMRYDANVIAGK